jgi:non-ribosomal peptide synthetase component E (peptide arylation enzyme)
LQPSIITALTRQCEKQPDALALIGESHTLTYQDLGRAIEQVGALLNGQKTGTGARQLAVMGRA